MIKRFYSNSSGKQGFLGKGIAILLLACFFVPFTTGFFFLQYQKTVIRREVKHKIIEGLELRELALVKLTIAEAAKKLKWEHSKEFEYEGKMYDVVTVEQQDEFLLYWCWLDEDETMLNKKLNRLLARELADDPQRADHAARYVKLIKTLYFVEKFDWQCFSGLTLQLLTATEPNYLSLTFTPLLPPPRKG